MKIRKDIDIIPIIIDKFPVSITNSNIEIVIPILSSILFSDDILQNDDNEIKINDTRDNTYTFKSEFSKDSDLSYYDRILLVIPNKNTMIRSSLYISFWYNIKEK